MRDEPTRDSKAEHRREVRQDFPCLTLSCPVDIQPRDRDGVRGVLHTLSRSGIVLSCDREAARELVAIIPDGQDHEADYMEATLVLWPGEERVELEAVCHRLYLCRTAEDRVAMGFDFISLSADSERGLTALLERWHEPT